MRKTTRALALVCVVGLVAAGLKWSTLADRWIAGEWFDGPGLSAGGRIGGHQDVRVLGDRIYILSDPGGLPYLEVSELTADRKLNRTVKVEAVERNWLSVPKRPNVLFKNDDFLVFAGEGLEGSSAGLVTVDVRTFDVLYAPVGPIEEMTEGSECLFVEVLVNDDRVLHCFRASDQSFERLPSLGAKQDVKSMVPDQNDGLVAFVEIGGGSGWYRYQDSAWTLADNTTSTQFDRFLQDWSGGTALVLLPGATVGVLRRIDGQPVLNKFGPRVSSTFVGVGEINNRIVFDHIDGRLITTNAAMNPVEVARRGHPFRRDP
jgi:hypothetical protein